MDVDLTGTLSYSWPMDPSQTVNRNDPNYEPLFAYGFGLRYGVVDTLSDELPAFDSAVSTADEPGDPSPLTPEEVVQAHTESG